MHRIDGPDVVFVLPVPSAVGTPGFFRKATIGVRGTVMRTDFANAVMLEIENVITGAGLVLDKTLQDQMQTAIDGLISATAEVAGMKSDLADTGSDTTTHTRALVGSTGSQASGANSGIYSSDGCLADTFESAVLGSLNATASGIVSAAVAVGGGTVSGVVSAMMAVNGVNGACSGDHSAVLASEAAAAAVDASGDESLVAATFAAAGGIVCSGSTSAILAFSGTALNAGSKSAFIACSSDTGAGPTSTGGDTVFVAASDGGSGAGTLVSGTRAAAIASGGGGGATTVSGIQAAALGVGGGTVSGTHCVSLASTGGVNAGDQSIVGATSGTAGNIDAAAAHCVILGSSSGSGHGATSNLSAIIAANGCDIGDNAASSQSAIMAATNCDVDAVNAFIAACDGDTANGDDVDIEGARSAIIACSGGTTTARTLIAADAVESAIIASRDALIDATSGTLSRGLIAASTGASITGATPENNAIVACRGAVNVNGSQGFAAACGDSGTTDVEVSGDKASTISVSGSVNNDVINFALLGSDFDNVDFDVSTTQNTPGIGGGSAAVIRWRIESATGSAFLELLSITSIKSGATQGAAGAAADEVWKTASHATLPDNVLLIGV